MYGNSQQSRKLSCQGRIQGKLIVTPSGRAYTCYCHNNLIYDSIYIIISFSSFSRAITAVSFHYSCDTERRLSLTWGTHSEWGCGRTDGKLWDTCRNRAAPLHSDIQHTSPHWDLLLARFAFQTLLVLRAEGAGLSRGWRPIEGLEQGRKPSAVVWVWTEPRCCCLEGWTAPTGRELARYIQ